MYMSQSFRGVFVILQTPFDTDGNLVWSDFEREADFIARSGAHGFVWPVMASEFTVISADERIEGMRRAVQTINGRIPVVIGVADTSAAGAVAFAKEAGTCGADGVIAMPPWATKISSPALMEQYYRAIAEAAGVPVIIQNADAPLGSSLSAKVVVDLCQKIPRVEYVKEEKSPQGHSVSELIGMSGNAVKGVFSGASALYLIPEHKRGICGNMPGCVTPDIDAQMWNLLESGKDEEARNLWKAKVAFESCLTGMGAFEIRKEVLRRRGVLTTGTAKRGAGLPNLDEIDVAEFDYAMSLVEPHFML
jgi:dihydrodipicolinate synthase/N-acetylneuraminate lyase